MPIVLGPLHHAPEPEVTCVEVATFLQIPGFQIVGLAGREVAEARERVRAAVAAMDLELPRRKIILNLAPAHVPKRGTGLDLPMALALLLADRPELRFAATGELSLNGSVRSVGRAVRSFIAAWRAGAGLLILPEGDLASLQACSSLLGATAGPGPAPRVRAVRTLREAMSAATETHWPGQWVPGPEMAAASWRGMPGVASIGPAAARLLAAAAAGQHHLLLLGPRGTGKSVAVETLIRLWPEPDPSRALCARLIQELREPYPNGAQGAVRKVGAQCTAASLVGRATGDGIFPGEFALANGGLLVADELPEWKRDARESLREPLQEGTVTLSRAAISRVLPAAFGLAATGNLCPCGAWPRSSGIGVCCCGLAERQRYLRRLSGPILDRVDLVHVMAGEVSSGPGWVPIAELASRVSEARSKLTARFALPPGAWTEARISEQLIAHPRWRVLAEGTQPASLRSLAKTLRVAVTLATLDGREEPTRGHFTEAACYRPERSIPRG
ncbi:MAG: ATP-binding protein [Bdellovibrionales bacterium]|nr:ATP-binding protein [Bdellovibrionales bacterium]